MHNLDNVKIRNLSIFMLVSREKWVFHRYDHGINLVLSQETTIYMLTRRHPLAAEVYLIQNR